MTKQGKKMRTNFNWKFRNNYGLSRSGRPGQSLSDWAGILASFSQAAENSHDTNVAAFAVSILISAYLCSLNKRPGGELKHSSNDSNLKLSLQVKKYVKEWQKQQSKEVIIYGRDYSIMEAAEEAESQSNYQLSKSPMTVAKAYFPSCYNYYSTILLL